MDPRVTRRSARLEAQRPRYPQSEAATVPHGGPPSAFTSSSSLSSMSSADSDVGRSSSVSSDQTFDAPMPSPIQPQQNYFGQFQQSQAQTQQAWPQQPCSSPYTGQRGGMGGLPETLPFLNNVNLIAEAAKRAQMACLMRDMGDVSL